MSVTRVLGITGGICAGKSRAASILASRGATVAPGRVTVEVLDADKLGHQVYASPDSPGFRAIREAFGEGVVSGESINRAALGSAVFGNPANMKRLTDIVWPEISRLAQDEVTALKEAQRARDSTGLQVVVLEAAVLVEAGWFDVCDTVWTCEVPPAVAIARLKERNNLSHEEAEKRLSSQISNAERAKHAELAIDTNREKEETEAILLEHFRKYVLKHMPPAVEDTGSRL